MKTRTVKYKSAPGYPSRRQYLEYRALAGAAAIGLSAMTGGCKETVLGEMRYAKPEQVSNSQTDKTQAQPQSTNSARGANTIAEKPVPIPLAGVPMPVNPDAIPEFGTTYTVKDGDTLSAISKKMLGSSGRWKEIIKLNPGLNPNKLQIGQIIKIPKMGEPKVMESARGGIEENNQVEPAGVVKNIK